MTGNKALVTRLRDRVVGLSCDDGFTLLETLGVMVIVGLLVATAAPQVSRYKEKERVTSMKSDITRLANLVESSGIDLGRYPNFIGPSVVGKFTLEGGDVFNLNDGNLVSVYRLTDTAGTTQIAVNATDFWIVITNANASRTVQFKSYSGGLQ